ncbi:MAG: hypothetical protein ABIH23_29225 [bacterium]
MMSLWCKRRQKRLLADLETGRQPSEADRQHVRECPRCKTWYAQQEQLSQFIAQVHPSEPGPHLTAEVMAFIYRQEENRHRAKSESRRRPFSLGPVLRREAWPIAFATLAILWGLAPTEWKDRSQVDVVAWVQSIPNRLDQECAELQRKLAERLAAIIPINPPESADPDQTSGVLLDRAKTT